VKYTVRCKQTKPCYRRENRAMPL